MKSCKACDAPLIPGESSCLVCGAKVVPNGAPRSKMSEAEKLIAKAQKEEARRVERERKEAEKEAERLAKQKTEADHVRQYAKLIMAKQRTRGMVTDKFKDLQSKITINKNLWQDQDFFFSVVFQSAAQKYQFLDHIYETFKIDPDDEDDWSIQILNGLKLAKAMGVELKKEIASDFPCGNIELRKFILDQEYTMEGTEDGEEDQGSKV